MLFNSITFLVFFLVVFTIYRLPLPWRLKKTHLTVSSYIFYAAWNPPFVILLWLSTAVDWFVAKRMAGTDDPGRRKLLLLASLATNLGLLGFFKYGNFLLDNFVFLVNSFGFDYSPAAGNIVLPVGISFFTFQTLSYTIDVYHRKMEPWKQFGDFALFVSFFPQLVAGPIVRAADFLPQCRVYPRATWPQMGLGLSLIVVGLFEKVFLADGMLAPVADPVYNGWASADSWTALVGTLAFSGQIYFDFAGYSTCAIGVALCFGFIFMDNFHVPYGAIGFSDFWRRWHISLSSWLRDYLYVPLGGNRGGEAKTKRNLLLTMLLGGLWHGASWRFMVWGGLHGLYLSVERILNRRFGGLPGGTSLLLRVPLALLTFALVTLTWTFFRAESFAAAFHIILCIFGVRGALPEAALVLDGFSAMSVIGLTALMLIAHFALRDINFRDLVSRTPVWLRVAALTGLIVLIILSPGDKSAFIYFQF